MTRKEAFEILGIAPSSSDEEAKKAFKKLALQYHPDRNQNSEEATAKFKEVNEAYNKIINNEPDQMPNPFSGGVGGFNINDIFMNEIFNDIFVGIPKNKQRPRYDRNIEPILTHIDLSFKETVLGCRKTIKFQKKIYCNECFGDGFSLDDKNCGGCGGTGQFTQRNQFSAFSRTCSICGGTGKAKKVCSSCGGQKCKTQDEIIELNIPPIYSSHQNMLIIKNKGNELRANKGDLAIKVNAKFEGEPGSEFEDYKAFDENICSFVDVPLDILLFGGNIEVRTIHGELKKVTVSPKSETGNQCTIKGCGIRIVSKNIKGNHIVEIRTKFPKDDKLTDELKKALKELYE